METRSAKHLVLLSRSGARGEAALTLLRELEGKGIEVIAPSCDISDESALVAALEHFPKRLPPTNGCIQASMVLKVSFLAFSLCTTHAKTIARMGSSKTWSWRISMPLFDPRSKARGTYTLIYQKEWTSLSCCLPPVGCLEVEAKAIMRWVILTRIHLPDIACCLVRSPSL